MFPMPHFDPKWQIPCAFTPIKVADQDFVVGIRTSLTELPYLQVIVTDLSHYYVSIFQTEDQLAQLMAFNDAFISSPEDIRDVLVKLSVFETTTQTSDFQVNLDFSSITMLSRATDFEFKVPLLKMSYADQKVIDQKFKVKLMQFSFIQSSLITQLASQIETKNQIIMKLSTSIAQDYAGNTFKTDNEILQNKRVQGLFLKDGKLSGSLGTTLDTCRMTVEKDLKSGKYVNTNVLGTIFGAQSSRWWSLSPLVAADQPDQAIFTPASNTEQNLFSTRVPTNNGAKYIKVERSASPFKNDETEDEQTKLDFDPTTSSTTAAKKRRRKINIDPTPIKQPRYD
ncbi:hypothetical protein CANARDRAFT_57440 [[Candida] arabinofermentans NRRL YB-2248]|uniref:Uncharacterized protein n=1 Tax=[Candida] arabinofermentans NRRL YB-2248 TaxID=983967 RepID=A0A1E4T8Q2_9ASCO|nr:hypothetical protein CANARDRAFT_57440 [[Candida] arabinofermentans NRRL YB-2248]